VPHRVESKSLLQVIRCYFVGEANVAALLERVDDYPPAFTPSSSPPDVALRAHELVLAVAFARSKDLTREASIMNADVDVVALWAPRLQHDELLL